MMEKVRFSEKNWAKILAFCLCCLFIFLSATCAIAIAKCVDLGLYDENPPGFAESDLCQVQVANNLMELSSILAAEPPESLNNWSPSEAFTYVVRNSTGAVVADTTDANSIVVFSDYTVYSGNLDQDGNAQIAYTVDGCVQIPVPAGSSYYTSYLLFNFLHDNCRALIWFFLLLILADIVLFSFLIYSAGHVAGKPRPTLRGLNRCPLDLYLLLTGLLVLLLLNLTSGYLYYQSVAVSFLTVALDLAICVPLFLGLCITLSARIKAGGMWKNTVIYRFCALIIRLILRFFKSLPVVWKTVVAYLLFMLLNLICLIITVNGGPLAFMLICLMDMAVFAVLVLLSLQLRRIKNAVHALADGDLSYTVETENLLWDFRDIAEDINRVNAGMSKAIDARLRSERFKTELITNVSHDLKTPLTSIVSYVDLLKKTGITDPDACAYIDVLDRQSAKLKKLTEDLVEASKASSGVINVNKTQLNVTELLSQSVAEYADRFEKAQITPVLTTGNTDRTVEADGRLLWRVFDNLLQNICKYAMPGTRAYIDVTADGAKTGIAFKNISADALNITSEELMERFVRGDQSRHTEGSGLGLSIARSLTELQGGTFELQVDGDLFKAIVTI